MAKTLNHKELKILYVILKSGVNIDGLSIESIDSNNCAIRAVRDATNVNYELLDDMFSKFGRSFNKGTPLKITIKVLNKLGYEVVNVTQRFQSKTVRTFQREVRFDKNTYLVRTNGHILCVKNYGQTSDWANNKLNRILEIYKVIKV